MPVEIYGKEYYTVAERTLQIHDDIGKNEPLEILTEILNINEIEVVVKATIRIALNEGLQRMFTGHAHERWGSNQINKTSALENCETSAIGRALAAAGYIGSEYCSADELAQALANKDLKVTEHGPPTHAQKKLLNDLMKEKVQDEDMKKEIIERAKKAKTTWDFMAIIKDVKKL